MSSANKPTVFLLDSMSFIFRAYHAMQRQRPFKTKRVGIAGRHSPSDRDGD